MRTTNQTLTRLIVFLCLAVPSLGRGSSVFAYDNPFANTSVTIDTDNHTATVRKLPRNSDERFNSSSLPTGTCEKVTVDLTGDGSEDHPFEIGTVDQWNAFAFIVNDVAGKNDSYAKLTADITFPNNHSQPGLQSSSSTPGRHGTALYSGTFDGQGHTITLNFNEYKENGVLAGGPLPGQQGNSLSSLTTIGTWGGLFFYVGSATIKNLHVAGTIRSQLTKCGTIAHHIEATSSCSLINCQSTVKLISVNGSSAFGGLVGEQYYIINISNCIINNRFSTNLEGKNNTVLHGGIIGVGWKTSTDISIINSYVKPQDIIETNVDSYHSCFYPFVGFNNNSGGDPIPTITNSYYKFPDIGNRLVTSGTNQGTAKAAPAEIADLITGLNSGDNASLAVDQKPWIAHNGTVYLRTFAKYVHIDGWTYGSPNTPTIVGNNGNGAVTYQYKVQGADDNTYATYTPGTTVLNVGNYTLKASVAANNGWNAWESTMDFTVSAATLTISGTPTATAEYGTQVKDIPISATALLGQTAVAGTWAFPSDNTTVPSVSSTTAYTATFTPTTGAGNYNSLTTTITPTITPKPLTITGITASNKTYDGNTTATLDYSNATLAGKVGGDDLSVSATGQFASKDVGIYKTVTITPILGGTSAGNYEVASCNSPKADIAPKPLTVTAKDKTITYGDAPANDGVTYSGFITGEDENTDGVLGGTLAYTYSYAQYGDVGNAYTITPKGLTSTNYSITFTPGTLTVEPKEVGLEWSTTTTFEYDGDEHAPTATATGLVNSDEVGVTVTGAQTNASEESYVANAIALTGDKSGNYKLPTDVSQTFIINQKSLTITAKDKTITYGDAPANDGVTYSGFITGEDENTAGVLSGTLAYTYTYAQYGDVGNAYTITPSGLTSSNYAITVTPGTLTVEPKEVGLEWSTTTTFEYDGDEHAPTATATGLVNGDEVGVTVTGAQTNASEESYVANAIALTGDKSGNYKLPTDVSQTFIINQKSLTITAKDKTITYGEAPANDGVTYSGFVTGEDENTAGVLGRELVYDYSYAQYGDVGSYTITPSGLTSANYDINFKPGTLTVEPKEVGLEWSTTTTFEYDGDEHAPTATATGLINGDEVGVTVGGAQTDACEEGYVANATALTGDKSGNYKLPTDVSQNFIINRKEVGITWGHTLLTYNGSAQAPTAQATGLVGADECNLTVDGGQTAVGAYTATVTGMTGSSKDNYKLPTTGLSTDYEIVNPLSISFAANQTWATWYGDYDYEVPEGTMAYTVSSVNGSTVTVDGITYVPANTGVLIKRETTGTATVANSNVYYDETCDYTSLLKSGDPTPYQDYILYGNEFVLSSVSAIGEHRCYLPGTGAASARRLTIEMGEAPTGISPKTVGETDSGEWYDLQGRRIGKPQGKGLYIRDGKKVVIK